MTTVQLEYESVPTPEGETRIMVIAWDVLTSRPLAAGRLAAMAQWLSDNGYNYITATNGRWSDEIGS